MSQGSSHYSTTLHPNGLDLTEPVDGASDRPTTFLISHETRFTGHEIRRLFEWNPDAWLEMIPHLSNRERWLLREEFQGESDPALQDLAAQLAQD